MKSNIFILWMVLALVFSIVGIVSIILCIFIDNNIFLNIGLGSTMLGNVFNIINQRNIKKTNNK